MKILITSLKYPGKIGVTTYIEQLVQGLKHHGHHVDLFCHTPSIKNAGKSSPSQAQMITAYQNEASKLPFANYDIIHAQGIIPSVAISRIKPRHTPLVASLHGALAFNQVLNGALALNTPAWRQSFEAESKAITSSDICIVGSQWLKNVFFKDYKVDINQPFGIVPYGIDIEEFIRKMHLPSHISRPLNKFIIVCTARLVPLKGHQYLLNALAELKKVRKDWACWLIGGGPLLNQLRQQVNRLGLSGDVKFLGNQENVASLLKMADMFVFPSLQDNMPYAVMEAQIAGIPVVVSDAGGIPEMVKNGETGLIFPKRNSHSLFLTIRNLMENQQFREFLAKNAYNWAIDHWSITKMIENTIAEYHRALQLKNK
ncbi:glycosyltransferase family 4 protein [Bacillus sp. EB600]|uniref:glycosyltransferase family 4 protein n=1 Tax=Bacillus sp. EB600 TaxID=2806345 RepID=UPI00210B905E|nr:glycosyltransferase family 4 protein [Bacillus sp. EB600]MCQ6282352.1 glycosyltransferase family 4 protein [Bacillus sp. EB600]